MMGEIYLDIIGKKHSLYNELINYPPDGYKFITEKTAWGTVSAFSCKLEPIYTLQQKLLSNFIPVNLTKSYIERFKKIPENADLTYSSGHLVFRNEPWVVDLEFITHLAGYNYQHFKRYRRIIEKMLRSENCKKIMPWTEAGKKTILLTIHDTKILDKVETVHLAVHKKDFVKQYNKDKVKLLFVGSVNIPKDFDIKGGKEVFEAFSHLNRRYDNLELIVRSYVPENIKMKCAEIRNIRIIDKIIRWEELEQEFKSADIFLFPSHNTPGLAILDAMSYELPVITTDVWANPEMVRDGETGFLVKKSKNIDYYIENFIPNWSSSKSLQLIKSTIDPEVICNLVEKASILIEDEKLRRKMGRAGRKESDNGKFSIDKRNIKLKKILDQCL